MRTCQPIMESQGGMCLSISLDQRRWRRMVRGEMARQAHEHIGQRHKKSKLFSQPSLFSQERMAIATLLSLHRCADGAGRCRARRCPVLLGKQGTSEANRMHPGKSSFLQLETAGIENFRPSLVFGRPESCSFRSNEAPVPQRAFRFAIRPIDHDHT